MKILVIDTADRISSSMIAVDAEIMCYRDEIQALNAAEQLQPNLILLNHSVQEGNTAEYVRLLLEASPRTNLVVLGERLAEDAVIRCVLSGAKGFQELQQFSQYRDRLMRAVADGEAWLSRKLVATLIERVRLLPV